LFFSLRDQCRDTEEQEKRFALAVARLAHGSGASGAGAAGWPCLGASGLFAFGCAIGRFEIAILEKFGERGVVEGFRGHLPGFSGPEEQLFPAG
jgi:hypothetical protein